MRINKISILKEAFGCASVSIRSQVFPSDQRLHTRWHTHPLLSLSRGLHTHPLEGFAISARTRAHAHTHWPGRKDKMCNLSCSSCFSRECTSSFSTSWSLGGGRASTSLRSSMGMHCRVSRAQTHIHTAHKCVSVCARAHTHTYTRIHKHKCGRNRMRCLTHSFKR